MLSFPARPAHTGLGKDAGYLLGRDIENILGARCGIRGKSPKWPLGFRQGVPYHVPYASSRYRLLGLVESGMNCIPSSKSPNWSALVLRAWF